MISGQQVRAILLSVLMLVSVVAVGASGVAGQDGPDGNEVIIGETSINTDFIGTLNDPGTITVEATNITGQPSDITFTIGSEPVATAAVSDGSASTTIDPTTLGISPGIVNVSVQGHRVSTPAAVEVVHEVRDLDAGFNLVSVPQAATVSIEDVGAVNRWNPTTETYETVTDNQFDDVSALQNGLYVSGTADTARLGYTFIDAVPQPGTASIEPGWNFVSSNFAIDSADAGDSRTLNEDLINVDASVVDAFTADFSQQLGSSAQIDAFDAYWIFNGEDSALNRAIITPPYDPQARESTLGTQPTGSLDLRTQVTNANALGTNATQPSVTVENASASVNSAVVVTYEDDGELVIAGVETVAASNLDGGDVTVPVSNLGGFPGEHTANLIPTDRLSSQYSPGDTVSDATASEVVAQASATIGTATVQLESRSEEDAAESSVTVSESAVQPPTEYVIVVHEVTEAGEIGAPIGNSTPLTGSQSDVTISVGDSQITNTTEFVAMLHYSASDAPYGSPILNSDATEGFVAGNVADSGEVSIFSAEGAELSFQSQAVGTDDDGNAVVYTDEIEPATLAEQERVSDPSEDFVVLYEGDTLTPETVVDVQRIEDATNGTLLLEATDATPGTHTVELFGDSRTDINPDAVSSDNPLIENTQTEINETAVTGESYILLLEDELTAAPRGDREATVTQLRQEAEVSQQPVADSLRALDASVDTQFWLINGLVTTAPNDVTAADLRAIDGVEEVIENVEATHPRPTPVANATQPQRSTTDTSNVTYGLAQIDVPGFEEQYQTQGEGSRVAIIDDGLNPDHPDINVSKGVNVVNGEIIVPDDGLTRAFGEAHGEHVAGTAVGTADPARDSVPRYSVAPGADLLKANIWPGNPTLGDTIAAIQWSVEEDADVTSMSLGFGQGAGENIVSTTMARTIDNANAAGTVVIGSAGNEGSGAAGGPVTSPGAEFNSFSIGATDSTRQAASFSSGAVVSPNDVLLVEGSAAQYPATYPRSYTKPDVTAPGVNVLSTGPLGGNLFDDEPSYSRSSGTSMAAPHVAGAVALIQSATATEHSPAAIENALIETAEKPTTQFANQTSRDVRYGTGIINVTAATMALENTTTVTGTVTTASGEPLTGAKISTNTGVVTSSAGGNFSVDITDVDDSVTITADAFGYTPTGTTVDPTSNGTTGPVTFALEPKATVELVAGQPAFSEYDDEFTMVVDVRNLDAYTVELANTSAVTADDVTVSVDGTPVTLGESTNFDSLDANGVPVTVTINGSFSEGDQFALNHTFAGAGNTVTVTTGPTTLTETINAPAFELSNFVAPSGQAAIGTAEPYFAQATITNVGQQTGTAEAQWFLGPLGLAGSNPTTTLAPGESEDVVLNFGEIDIGAIFGASVEVLQGFEVEPAGANATGDVTTATFTVETGQVPLTNPIGQSRAVSITQDVVGADVTFTDPSFSNETSSVTIDSTSVQPSDTDYVVVVHENTAGLPVLGNSSTLNGSETNVTVSFNQSISAGTDLVAMLHFAANDSAYGAPIQAYDADAGSLQPVTDTATLPSEAEPVMLDSVSSLLNASNEPLTNDSVVAVAAEPTATNTDEDGNGDAVPYPSETDIPVVAVDGTVVGVTGPFVTSDTDFSYGNEEVMLNIYNELLGGSGTILHDEGHGQFYTLSDNDGDDYQTFAAYAESNGYTYEATTNVTGNLSRADAVVITTPGEAYSQRERDALAEFAANGGVVVLHDQSDFNDFDATANHNEIASAVNASFRFNDDQVVDPESNTGAQFVPVTSNYNTETFPSLFGDRDGLGVELDVNETYTVDVVDIADGDTVDVQFDDGTVETVRIVGLDTPETGTTDERLQEFEGIDDGPALRTEADNATAYARERLANQTVTLRFDENEGLRGNFGRLLGFLELSNGSVYNEEVIEDGWARVYDSGFNQHDSYWELEQSARANNDGIWKISDPAATPETGDSNFSEVFIPEPVAVSGGEVALSAESGEPLVAVDTAANVAVVGGPLIEENFEAGEGGPGIDEYGNYPFLTNTIAEVSNADSGPVVIDSGHGQFASDAAVSAEDAAYYLRYLEGQSPGNESFIGLEASNNLAIEPGPDLLTDNGTPAARALVISAPTAELTAAERTTVTEFADAGGAVVLVGSAADQDAVSNFDPVLSDLNASVSFTTESVTDASNSLTDDPAVFTTGNVSDAYSETFLPFTPGNTTPTTPDSLGPVALDSVSSLLNADNGTLTDDSVIAVSAESTATNTDQDGNGDAVSYPSNTDIPVIAVDGSVVGVTGPFVTSNTNFSYANEEIMLNVYDELVGGSGTILHDEGHGQFYTLSDNGGDDFQTFASYAESNGYTYEATTNVTGNLSRADAVVITTPSEAFSQPERDALAEFVANGGVVFLHDQSDFNDFDATANHNEIASTLNASFRFNDDQVIDTASNTGAEFVPVTRNYNTETFSTLFDTRDGLGIERTENVSSEMSAVEILAG